MLRDAFFLGIGHLGIVDLRNAFSWKADTPPLHYVTLDWLLIVEIGVMNKSVHGLPNR